MTPVQCRMARAALQLSHDELARKAKCSALTLARFEAGKLRGAKTLPPVQRALEAAGCVFLKEDKSRGVGVFMKKAPITVADLSGRIEQLETRVASESKGPPSPEEGMRLLEIARKQNVTVKLKNRRTSLLESEQR